MPTVDPTPIANPTPVVDVPPVRLIIPAIGVDAQVNPTGQFKGGIQSLFDQWKVGWYNGSVYPGQRGDAVIEGHLDWYAPPGSTQDAPAVFLHMDQLQIGDLIEVQEQNGQWHVFIVDQPQTTAYYKDPITFTKGGDQSRLILITCYGGWVEKDKTRDHRRFVYATLVN